MQASDTQVMCTFFFINDFLIGKKIFQHIEKIENKHRSLNKYNVTLDYGTCYRQVQKVVHIQIFQSILKQLVYVYLYSHGFADFFLKSWFTLAKTCFSKVQGVRTSIYVYSCVRTVNSWARVAFALACCFAAAPGIQENIILT